MTLQIRLIIEYCN